MKPLAEYLRNYNDWRRGADTEQPDPTELGERIDSAIASLTMLEETAKLAAALKAERDEARERNAKLREIAERAISDFNGCKAQQLRAELAQLKEVQP